MLRAATDGTLMSFFRTSSALFGLAALAAAGPAPAAELLIAAPSACTIGDELSHRAERALGQPLESAADVRCTVHITRDGEQYAARLEVQGLASAQPSRLRSFSAPNCDMLTDTLALAVSLAIASGTPEPVPSGLADAALSPAAPSPAAPSPAAPSPPARSDDSAAAAAFAAPESVDAPSATREESDERGGPRVGGSAALVADAGTLPGVGMGASLGASFGIYAFDLRLVGTYLPPRATSVGASSTASGASSTPGAEIELLAGSLLGCAPRVLRASEVAFGVCAGAELGWLEGKGTGVTVSRSGGSLWKAVRADAEARWTLAQGLGLDVRLSALVPWERDEFSVDGVGRVFRTGAVVGRATVGLSYELGSR
jgi:hypothetical protein